MKNLETLLEKASKNFEAQEKRITELEQVQLNKSRPDVLFTKEQTKANNKDLVVKNLENWINSGEKEYGSFAKKGLGFANNPALALAEAELNANVIEQAIENSAILNAVGSRGTENLEYRRTVLSQRPNVKLTKENTSFSSVVETDASDYTTIDGQFVKAYSYPQITVETANFSEFQVAANLQKLVSEDHALTMQQQILHGTGIVNGDGITEIKGITNGFIDRANTYTEALKPASTRLRDVLAAVKSDAAADIGTTSTAVEANLYKLMLTVPERSQATASFAMNENTLSFLMQTLKDTQGRSLIQIELLEMRGVWVRRIQLFGAPIILNETIDDIGANNAPIIFGDFKAGVELLMPSMSTHMIQDPYTLPDVIKFYQSVWFGSTVADHEALAVLVCVA